MNFLSTKQLSEQWGISSRRIVMLASQGRITGAKQIDGRWFIPENAARPEDPRKHRRAPAAEKDRYIFPFPLAVVSSPEQLNDFTEEEKDLYRLGVLYEQGSFAEVRELAETLLSSDNPYIHLGALYLLPTTCMFLSDFDALEKYFILFHTECQNMTEHRTEISFLRRELDAELGNFSIDSYHRELACTDLFPDNLLPVIGSHRLISDVFLYKNDGIVPDITAYEIICRLVEEGGWFYSTIVMHLYLSMYYAFCQKPEQEYRHMKTALELGLKHGILFTPSYTLCYNSDLANRILCEYPLADSEHIRKLSGLYVQSRDAYTGYCGKAAVLKNLNADDYILISCCMKKFSIEQMSVRFGLTHSGINKRLSVLYGKLGVKSKNELVKVYLQSVLNWNKD